MSEFTEVSRAGYEAISRDDVKAFVKLADKDVEFDSLIEGRSYHGHDGIREWWKNVIQSLGGVDLELDEVHDFDDRGYVKMIATVKEEDVEFPREIWQAVRIEDGKAVWWGVFATEKETKKALGVK